MEYWRIARRASATKSTLLSALQQLRQRRLRHSQLLQRSYVWQTPFKFSNKFVNGAFGGWTMSQNFFARSGLPFTVLDGTTGIGNYKLRALPSVPAQVNGGSP